jgi:hypothetical protein
MWKAIFSFTLKGNFSKCMGEIGKSNGKEGGGLSIW